MENFQQILDLVLSGDEYNHLVAYNLMIGQGLSDEEIIGYFTWALFLEFTADDMCRRDAEEDVRPSNDFFLHRKNSIGEFTTLVISTQA